MKKRLLTVDEKTCIGCRACSAVCPVDLIRLSDEDGVRRIDFPGICDEDCQECARACPEEAIDLVFGEVQPEFVISFDLVPCQRCGAPFVTYGEMDRLGKTIPQELQTDAFGASWMTLCPRCRRSVERERAAKTLQVSRRGTRA